MRSFFSAGAIATVAPMPDSARIVYPFLCTRRYASSCIVGPDFAGGRPGPS